MSLLGQEQMFRALADVLSKSLMLTSGLSTSKAVLSHQHLGREASLGMN